MMHEGTKNEVFPASHPVPITHLSIGVPGRVSKQGNSSGF